MIRNMRGTTSREESGNELARKFRAIDSLDSSCDLRSRCPEFTAIIGSTDLAVGPATPASWQVVGHCQPGVLRSDHSRLTLASLSSPLRL